MNGIPQERSTWRSGLRSAMGGGGGGWMMPFHLLLYQKSDYHDDERTGLFFV